MIFVPNLELNKIHKFLIELENYDVELNGKNSAITFDFSRVKTCDPLPMLIVSSAIRKFKRKYSRYTFIEENRKNSYAQHMNFYKACDLNTNDIIEKGSNTYSSITKLEISDLRAEGITKLVGIQEIIQNKSESMAKILSQDKLEYVEPIKYILLELMRNIPEHSKADSIWYAAQYWPSYDLVEVSILDEGIGVFESIKNTPIYKDRIKTNLDALKLALLPGVSRTFTPDRIENYNDVWQNSGFGLYVVSQLCIKTNASFFIASGNDAIKKENGQTKYMSTFLQGTAIQIRFKPSKLYNFKEMRAQIVLEGEKQSKTENLGITSASKASRGFS